MFAINLFFSMLRVSGILLFSLLLAALAIAYLAIYHPQTLETCLNYASDVKQWLTNNTNTGISSEYNVWLKFLIQEQQLVFMFFVIVMRLVLVLITASLSWIYNIIRAQVG